MKESLNQLISLAANKLAAYATILQSKSSTNKIKTMKPLSLILFAIIFCFSFSIAKAENKEFDDFARHQHDLLNTAYEKHDVKTYSKLLDELLEKYNKLNAVDQKDYLGYLIDGYYNFSCTYSLVNQKELAISYLSKAIKVGYMDYMHIKEDSDLDNIRHEPAFIALIQPLRNVGDYLYIIQKAGLYNNKDNRQLPAFTYQAADNPNLAILRKTFNLDSIAGTGNDVSKVLNLMYWIHNLVPHDGNKENPTVKNALSMINECKKEGRGLNCRGLATVLNECYLSLGIKSRFVTCLPKDSLHVDNDCHVIDMVYINSLNKWIWVDPTFCAYVMDDKGQLLGLAEVRERLVNNKPLIINPDANWNHKSSETKQEYLYRYMAKNLYRLECSTNSEYDLETKVPGKVLNYIDLLPLEYYKQKPDKTDNANPNGITYVFYNTNNPDAFWAAPGK